MRYRILQPRMKVAMHLKPTRLVTESVDRLTRFYEYVTGASATVLASGYVEFQRSPCAGLAIADVATVRSYGAGGAEPAANPINMLPTLALPSMYDAVHGAVSLFAGASSGTRSIGSFWLGFAPNLV